MSENHPVLEERCLSHEAEHFREDVQLHEHIILSFFVNVSVRVHAGD
jgi:hypothetical protein